MKHIICTLTLLFFFVIEINGQGKNTYIQTGTYGLYSDVSTFIELTLLDNNTFTYLDRFELGSTFKYSGKWKLNGSYILLLDCENNEIRPMPIEWKIKANELCGKSKRKNKFCLTWSK